MLLINKATSPDNTVYFISATINGILNQKDGYDYSQLYKILCNKLYKKNINFFVFTLAIDFLYLLNKIYVDKEGNIYVHKSSATDSKR